MKTLIRLLLEEPSDLSLHCLQYFGSDCIRSLFVFRPSFFYFLFYRFFSQQVSVGGRNKNKNKIHSDHFPIELKSKETQLCFLRF